MAEIKRAQVGEPSRTGLERWAGPGHRGPYKSQRAFILKIVESHAKVLIGEAWLNLLFCSLRSPSGSLTTAIGEKGAVALRDVQTRHGPESEG